MAGMFDTPAEAYDRFVGRYGPALAEELIAFAGVRPGARALDVGCGPGALAGELVALLGAEAVAAVDPSESFAGACRERLPGVRVEVAAAEDLPFEDGAFDAALCQLVVNFMRDAPKGVREMARVAGEGGVVAAAVWDYRGGMTMLRAFWDAALSMDPGAQDEGRHMRYGSREELEALWTAAGLDDVATGKAEVRASYDGFEDLWAPFERGVGPAGAYTVAQPPERRAQLKEELHRRLGEPEELTALAWLVRGTVAA